MLDKLLILQILRDFGRLFPGARRCIVSSSFEDIRIVIEEFCLVADWHRVDFAIYRPLVDTHRNEIFSSSTHETIQGLKEPSLHKARSPDTIYDDNIRRGSTSQSCYDLGVRGIIALANHF